MSRMPGLDVLRAVLAWSVVGLHVVWLSDFTGPILHATGPVGYWAVSGFIIMSGFFIARMLLKRQESYHVFLTRRFWRLFPAFIVTLALSVFLRPITLGIEPKEALREASEHLYYPWHAIAHVFMIHGLVPDTILPQGAFALNPPAWSVSLEWQCYLTAPVMLWFLIKFGRPAVVFGLLGSALMLVPPCSNWLTHFHLAIGAFLPQRIFFFYLGMVIALYPARLPDWKIRWPSVFVYLGEISYSTYLVHFPILAALNAFLPRDGMPPDLHAILLLIAGIPLILLFSVTLYECVEKRGIKFGNNLVRLVALA